MIYNAFTLPVMNINKCMHTNKLSYGHNTSPFFMGLLLDNFI